MRSRPSPDDGSESDEPHNERAETEGVDTDDEQDDSQLLPVVPDPVEDAEFVHDPIELRPYIEIRPSETTVDPSTVVRSMNRLHALLADCTKTGWRHRLTRSTETPLVEWLLVSDGRPDPHVRYFVGSAHSDLIDDLLAICRTCFPNSYEFRAVEWHPRLVEEYLPIPRPGEQTIEFEDGASIDTSFEPYVAGVEFEGHAARRSDWQTPLAPFTNGMDPTDRRRNYHERRHPGPSDHRAESHRVPLAGVVETIAGAAVPVVYQVVVRPHEDWSAQADWTVKALEEGRVTFGDHVFDFLSPRSREERRAYEPVMSDQARIEGIRTRDPTRTFCASVRAVALTRDDPACADDVARRLASSLRGVDGQHHTVKGRVATDGERRRLSRESPGTAIYTNLISRSIYHVTYDTFGARLPWRKPKSRGIVVASNELPSFCLVDGAGVTPDGQRALAARRRERSALALPPPGQLARYRPPGMALCMPLTHDRRPYGRALYLRPSQQDRHLVVVGDTGSGKSVLMEGAVLTNAHATAGPEILFDYKGGGTAEEYLRVHYAAHGNLDDVRYFDLSRVLPALSFFDIRPLLEAGVPREEARSRKAGHYEEILAGVMGAEKYGEAAESVKAVRNHLRALYDSVNGTDAPSHADLYGALLRSQRRDGLPVTTDDSLVSYFNGLAERDRDVFNKIMGGAVGRVETIATDGRLAPVFDHVPEDDSPKFDFADLLDEDVVVVFDFGGMEATVKRTLTLVILSNLWTALKARERKVRRSDEEGELPLVNLYLEEARDVGSTQLLDTLLAEGRSFGLSVALGLQYLEQLDSPDPERDTYREALNETATFVVGNVSVDTDLPRALATETMDPDRVARRLSSMGRGEWLVRPGSDFGDEPVKPFLAQSLPAPDGHPASDAPITDGQLEGFRAAFAAVERETADAAGLVQNPDGFGAIEEGVADDEHEDEELHRLRPEHRVDTLLPHTRRMPAGVRYDHETNAVCCEACGNRYDPAIEGMVRAIECCGSMDDVDLDNVPVCESNLKLSVDEIRASEWSLKQLLFMQAVYNAQQLRYDPREYDLLENSMVRLEEYVDIETDEIRELIDADLVRHDTDYPHRIYSVSSAGRDEIGESYREGIDYGHGKGDLKESSEHVFGVQLGIRLLEQEYLDDPESDVAIVRPYHELRKGELPASAFMEGENTVRSKTTAYEQRRLDVAGLDENENVIVAIEVERVNNDYLRAVPDDFDKMAACEPEAAIWIVLSRADGHTILQTLNDPLDGEVRVEKTYSENTPPQQFRIDTLGMTRVYPAGYVRDSMLE